MTCGRLDTHFVQLECSSRRVPNADSMKNNIDLNQELKEGVNFEIKKDESRVHGKRYEIKVCMGYMMAPRKEMKGPTTTVKKEVRIGRVWKNNGQT